MAADENEDIDFVNLIDAAPIGPVHFLVGGLCFVVAMLDGFDTLSIGFVAPLVAEALSLSKSEMSLIFSAALSGILIGSLVFSVIGDRLGRRKVIIAACIVIGVFSLLTSQSSTFTEFAAYRFFTGIGLGASLPNLYALVSDYAPTRRRAIMVTAMFVGFSVGATTGAMLSNWLAPRFGWGSVFFVGGIAPVLLAVALTFLLPESIRLLAIWDPTSPEAKAILARLDQRYKPEVRHRLVSDSPTASRVSPVELFRSRRAGTTILFWAIYFTNLMTAYSLASWMPTILSESGIPLHQAVWAASLTEAGGVIGGILMATNLDRQGVTFAISGLFVVAVLAFSILASAGGALVIILFTAAVLGFCITGGQHTLNALASNYYPSRIRSTGVGYSLASGRIGAILGPIIVGQLLAQQLGREAAFGAMAAMAVLSAILSIPLLLILKRDSTKS